MTPLFGICGIIVLLTLPLFLDSLSALNRWWKLAGVLLYWGAAWAAAETLSSVVGQLNLNWQEGNDFRLTLGAFVAALNTGNPLPEVQYNFL